MIDFIFFKLDFSTLLFWMLKIVFLIVGLVYIIYVLLQLRQIGIMNSTLKTRAAVPIAIIGIIHLILVVSVLFVVEAVLFFSA